MTRDVFAERDALKKQLARLTLEHKQGHYVTYEAAFEGVVGAVTYGVTDLGLPAADTVTAEDVVAGLKLLPSMRQRLDWGERDLVEAAKDRGMTWDELGRALGYRSGQAMQQRYKRLGGTKSWPSPPPRRTAAQDAATTHPGETS